MENLRHYVEHVGEADRHVIELPLDLTDEALEEFDRIAKQILFQEAVRVRVDCRHVRQLSGDAMGVLMAAHSAVTRRGGTFMLDVRDNPRLRDLFGTVWRGLDGGEADDNMSGKPAKLIPPASPNAGGQAQPKPQSDSAS